MRIVAGWVFTVFAVACGGDPCDREALQAELDSSGTGSVVVPQCIVSGALIVPAGVTLTGGGPGSEVSIPAGAAGIVLQSGTTPARLTNINVRSSGSVAVRATGIGNVELADVTVDVRDGVGIAFEDLANVTMNNVAIDGQTVGQGSGVSTTHGLVLLDVVDAQLTDVFVRGFSVVGAMFVSSTVEWVGGESADNRQVGLYAENGSCTLDSVALERTRADPTVRHAFGGFFTDGAIVTSEALTVRDNEGFGLVHAAGAMNGPAATHLNLLATGNDKPAIWSQGASAMEVTGRIADNGRAGVVAVRSSNLSLHDLEIEDTRQEVLALETSTITVGDGIHLVGQPVASAIDTVTIDGSGRAGILIELEGTALGTGLAITAVEVTTTGGIGARAQNGTIPVGWDMGITRVGTSSSADAAFMDQDPTGVIGPCERPRSNFAVGGLSSLIGP